MTDYQAVVYDLDGTLVRLDVNWDAVTRDVAAVLRARGLDPGDANLWDLLQRAVGTRHRPAVEETITEHERAGARTSQRLSLADDLPRAEAVGVCSLNSEAACRIALEIHGLDGYVDAIVGRDTIDAYKPDPSPLLAAVEDLGASPSTTLFVGDSQRDADTAAAADVDFAWASDYGGE